MASDEIEYTDMHQVMMDHPMFTELSQAIATATTDKGAGRRASQLLKRDGTSQCFVGLIDGCARGPRQQWQSVLARKSLRKDE